MIDRDDGDGFMRRWARRKEAARQAPEVPLEPEHEPAARPLAESSDLTGDQPVAEADPPLTDTDMPPIESLGEDSDYTGFMSPGVSEELRRLALRKLFLQPLFNVRDGLDDYDEDFRTFEKLGDVLTADMRFQQALEAERQAAAEARRTGAEDGDEVADDATAEQADEINVAASEPTALDADSGRAPDGEDDETEEELA